MLIRGRTGEEVRMEAGRREVIKKEGTMRNNERREEGKGKGKKRV